MKEAPIMYKKIILQAQAAMQAVHPGDTPAKWALRFAGTPPGVLTVLSGIPENLFGIVELIYELLGLPGGVNSRREKHHGDHNPQHDF